MAPTFSVPSIWLSVRVSDGSESYVQNLPVGFGQAISRSGTVNLLAYIGWVYIVRHVDYSFEVVEMGTECGFN
ncbi:hypothetical protein [Thermococcus cleftensis]|uniref:hypothetical protein n=1 Tax=Thermococcus cleftensis (strain DSM 27260 / KACC 17922 / CL1) TaxID=163003 RepID=UPI0011D1CB1A|nr:hypothetical protein [Thermococcus cleftensis]